MPYATWIEAWGGGDGGVQIKKNASNIFGVDFES